MRSSFLTPVPQELTEYCGYSDITLFAFRIEEYNSATGTYVQKQICSAEIDIPSIPEFPGFDVFISNEAPGFPPFTNTNTVGLFGLQSFDNGDGATRFRIKNIRLKKGTNGCTVTNIRIPNQFFNIVTIDGGCDETIALNGATARRQARFVFDSPKNLGATEALDIPQAEAETLTTEVIPQPQGMQLNINAPTQGDAMVTIFDLAGRLIVRQNMSLQIGLNQQNIDFVAPFGIYMVMVQHGLEKTVTKFVKTR